MKTIIALLLLLSVIFTACASKAPTVEKSPAATPDEIEKCKDTIKIAFDTPNPLTHIRDCFLDCCEKSGEEKKDCDYWCGQIN